MIPVPVDRPVYDGDIATYWFDDGILVSRSKPVRRTVANIAANVVLVQRITGGTPAPLLIHLARSPMPDRATLEGYCGETASTLIQLAAMILDGETA